MKPTFIVQRSVHQRRGSTLIIVIALLGLLSFVGMVFFSFASSERSAAEYFSDEKKGQVDDPDNVWDHLLKQVISGTSNRPSDRSSILYGGPSRHSLVSNMVGRDLSPFSGRGIHLIMEDDPATGGTELVVRVDLDQDGTADDEDIDEPTGTDTDGDGNNPERNTQSLLNFVDSPIAQSGQMQRADNPPAPDVDYTYPDINNTFLAYRGWAIRDNGASANPRYERVPVIIPSFMRPQYMKSSLTNGFGGADTATDLYWAYAENGAGGYTDIISPANRATNVLDDFQSRSFRPNPNHVSGYRPNGTAIYRYLTDAENSALATPLQSGPFPFVPENDPPGKPGNLNPVKGEMGIWTGSNPEAYELDVDNDGDGIREGIWLDTNFPVQETVDSSGTRRLYTVIHSVTIYDLDALIDINVHGNLAGLDRSGNLQTLGSGGAFDSPFTSRSNLGLGPNEVNPLWALRRPMEQLLDSSHPNYISDSNKQRNQFLHHFGVVPSSSVEQANLEWLWLLAGRAHVESGQLKDIFEGRWGESERLFNAVKPGGTFLVADLPRPGQPGDAQASGTTGIRFGGTYSGSGRDGFDDNQDRYDSEINTAQGRIRPYGTPMDYAGSGRTSISSISGFDTTTGRFLLSGGGNALQTPVLHSDTATTGPEQFIGFPGYSFVRDFAAFPQRYIYGQNGVYDQGTGDDLIAAPQYDASFEDALESIFDPDLADRRFDQTFGPQDVIGLHYDYSLGNPVESVSERLKDLAPYAFDKDVDPFQFTERRQFPVLDRFLTSGVRGRFTTVSNSLHRFLMQSPFGADGKPGDAGVNDDGDSATDEPDEVLYEDPMNAGLPGYKDRDLVSRWWEFTADADGLDANGDGFPDGDGNFEFPPAFGTTLVTGRPYSATDPFRPQVRRLLTIESGENRGLFGQMPLSPNHILDVERNADTPAEGTVDFLRYMQRAGMRFRPLTDHPLESESAGITSIPAYDPATRVNFPPRTVQEREFWARRDRQKLARDIYVLLYTTGGAGVDNNGTDGDPTDDRFVLDYTAINDLSPSATPLYTHVQLRRMAQFAVNLVDAMDSDNVITRFEYDKNLGPNSAGTLGGWNLDDDPFTSAVTNATFGFEEGPPSDPMDSDFDAVTAKGLFREDGRERGVVYGVEAQELTFSETLAARSQQFDPMYPPSDQMAHDESTEELNFLHIELQNLRPTEVALAGTNTGAGNEDHAIWQLVRIDRNDTTAMPTPAAAQEAALPTQTLSFTSGNPGIPGGERFSIAMASTDPPFPSPTPPPNPTRWGTADIYADHDGDGDFELVSPDVTSASINTGDLPSPHSDLDLIHSNHSGRWLASGNSVDPGQFCNALQPYQGNDNFGFAGATTNQEGFDLVLRRRMNPAMPELPLTSNPWIEVDRTRVLFENVYNEEMNTTSMMMEMVLRLNQAPSTERQQALAATTAIPYQTSIDPAVQAWRYNTIGSDMNSQSTAPPFAGNFEYQQVHFDREFSSSIEFLSIPVIGPQFLTHRFERIIQSPRRQVYPGYKNLPFGTQLPVSGTPSPDNISSAEAMFLMPNFPDTTASTAFESSRDNRWYRLFKFVEVPSRVHRMLGNYLTQQKVPGKINLNTVRHREVLAGLIDNPAFADVKPLEDRTPVLGGPGTFPGNNLEDGPFLASQSSLDDSGGVDGRDLWRDFLRDRDGALVTSAGNDYFLPGTASSRPFRSSGFEGASPTSDNGMDNTLMRRLSDKLGDGNFTNDRHWLEVANDLSHDSPQVASTNSQVRHQMLSKIMNNTTTVSNTFIVFGTAAYFEVVEDPATGMIQIGGRFDLDRNGSATNDEQRSIFVIDRTDAFQAYDPGTGDFNWRQLVKASVKVK